MLSQATSEPDILDVIGDLSSDKVFTPPRVANSVLDLLPDDIWTDPTLRWLDPGAKTGVFLREVTRRLMLGLVDHIADEQERLDHILKNMVFGVAVDEITALMSRRTLYCSKDATGQHSVAQMPTSDGNVWFDRVDHPYARNGRCPECSASRDQMESGTDNHAYGFIHATGRQAIEKELGMKFDVIVGNPPFQMEADAAGQNIASIYNHFVDHAKALAPKYVALIIPSRWMAGGRGLDDFRAEMLGDRRLRHLVDYPDSAELFPTVDIKGGICYFLWSRDEPGPAQVTTHRSGHSIGPVERNLDEFDVLVRDSRALPILRKVLDGSSGSFAELVTTRDPFGPALTSNFRNVRRKPEPGDLRLYMNQSERRGETWVDPTFVTRNRDLVGEWKLLLPKAGPGNSGGHVLPDMVLGRPIVAEPHSVCTLTYLVAGPFDTREACDSAASYLRSRFARFLVSLRKPSQDATRSVYTWVPDQTWDRIWTDEELYEKYGITDDEQAYIAEMIREMPT